MIELLKDKYNIIRKIGEGGMAEIYLASRKTDNKKVAIKIMSKNSRNDVVKQKRFKHEIEILKKIDSPYVAKMYDADMQKDYAYITMEYVDGHILKDYINKYVRLTVDETVEFAKQLALGFDEIHHSGVIHRDIKSPNIMIGQNGRVKIIDFGIALDEETERLTKTDMLIGSPQYISPELVRQEAPTIKSDIYALGVLIYEMLTGSVPFTSKNSYEILKKHQNSNIPKVTKTFPNVPQSLENIITKATSKDPHLRYKTMYDMYKDLDKSLSTDMQNEKPLNLGSRRKFSLIDIINSKWTLVAFVSILLIIVVVLVTVFAVKGL